MGEAEIRDFLSHLAVEGRVAASTQNQALNAILFLYGQVLEKDLGDFGLVERAKRPERLPVVLSRDEVDRLLGAMTGVPKLVAGLLYGSGLRVMEGLRLRVNSIDFERGQLLLRDAKGWKDRATVLPRTLFGPLRDHLARGRWLWEADRAADLPGVELPFALAEKYPRAGLEWGWQWAFPSPTLSIDPRSGIRRRHHLYETNIQRAVKAAVRLARIDKPATPHTLMIYTHVTTRGACGVLSPLDRM